MAMLDRDHQQAGVEVPAPHRPIQRPPPGVRRRVNGACRGGHAGLREARRSRHHEGAAGAVAIADGRPFSTP